MKKQPGRVFYGMSPKEHAMIERNSDRIGFGRADILQSARQFAAFPTAGPVSALRGKIR